MELESRLRSFAAVARAGSFSKAADVLFVSQPAVSKQVAALEAELGKQLLLRGPRGVTLTPAGQVLADYVLRAEALLANARRALGAGDDAQIGTLSLAASGVPGTYLLPAALAEFRELHPGVQLDFKVSTSGGALELVRAHEVELAVVGGLTVPPELDAEELVEDEIVLVGPPSFGGRRLRPRDLEEVTWLLREEGSATRAAVDAARWEMGLHAVRTLELPSWEAVKLAVAGGAGVAAISRFALDLELRAATLVVLDVPRWRLRRTISLVTARDVPLTLPAERFRAILRERLRADDEALPPNSNLPAIATPLVGRERELAEVTELLRSARLVTLTGAGGSGKTRLALEVAAGLVDAFRDGVFLVELAGLGRHELVEHAIADAVGEDLADRRLLLVLDNFEHVLKAARVVSRLLARTEHLRVLVTSRTRLRLRGETQYRLDPLAPADAVQLFVERALEADPRFEADAAVGEICARVDRLPLAIELAAARVDAFAPADLLMRLEHRLPVLVGGARDLPARQRTLRRTVEWSCDLLSPVAADAFERLAAFRGGWASESADELGVDAEALEELVDANLVQRVDARFTMLETIRELGRERLLARADADEIRGAHAGWALALAEEAHGYARGPEMQSWFHRLELEHDNLREALDWALERGDADYGLRLAAALEAFWTRRHHHTALAYVEPLLALDGGEGVERARVLAVAGVLGDEADHPHAEQWMRDGLDLASSLGDDEAAAWALKALGRRALHRGELDVAQQRFEESRALFEELEQWVPVGGRLNDLSKVARAEGDLQRAVELVHLAIDADARGGDPQGLPSNLHELGDLALLASDLDEARRSFADALRLGRGLGEVRIEAHALGGLAACFARAERRELAARIWSAVEEFERQHAPLDHDSHGLYEGELAGLTPHRPPLDFDEAVELALLERGE
jgi:DNA-binding transcriptional LysR family regulator/predicted ATPase